MKKRTIKIKNSYNTVDGIPIEIEGYAARVTHAVDPKKTDAHFAVITVPFNSKKAVDNLIKTLRKNSWVGGQIK